MRRVWFLIHDRRQLSKYTTPGISSDWIEGKRGYRDFRKYTVAMVELSPDGTMECREQGGSLMDCVTRHVEREMGCSLPWAKWKDDDDVLAPCDFGLRDTSERYDGIVTAVERLRSAPDMTELTGCRILCRYQQFTLRPLEARFPSSFSKSSSSDGPRLNWSAMQFVAVTGDGEVEVRTETLVYGWMDLVAEVGGYLGLLLGASVLSAYDFFANKKYVKVTSLLSRQCNK